MGEYAKAESLYREALRIHQKILGSAPLGTVQNVNNLAALYQTIGEYTKADRPFRRRSRSDGRGKKDFANEERSCSRMMKSL